MQKLYNKLSLGNTSLTDYNGATTVGETSRRNAWMLESNRTKGNNDRHQMSELSSEELIGNIHLLNY